MQSRKLNSYPPGHESKKMQIGYGGEDHNEDDEKHGKGLENLDQKLGQPGKLELDKRADDQRNQQSDGDGGDFLIRDAQVGILEYHVTQCQHPQWDHGYETNNNIKNRP